MLRTRNRRHALAVATIVAATTVAAAQNTSVSLSITFTDPAEGYGISADSGGAYIHRAEGRVPTVELNDNIQLDTRRSTRRVCFDFGTPVPEGPGASLAPADTCAPVLLRTLIRADYGGVGGLAVGEALDYGIDLYWTGPAASGGVFDYVLAYKRVDGNGVWVTHPDADTWTVENVINGKASVAKLSVYRKGKNGGWTDVGTYDMPVSFTAARLN